MPDPPFDWRRMTNPDSCSSGFAQAAQGIRGTAAFGEPEEWRFGWHPVRTREEWLDQVPTFGGTGSCGSFSVRYSAVVLSAVRTC
ncbi:hypothetical protein [Streptomyces canus]|uniref:hypothetical protein n=1 Tax=Streptomyces canus TaxID=58343 RepID=UPI00131A31D7|nr:hypothetical protein [Streptomyces canus]